MAFGGFESKHEVDMNQKSKPKTIALVYQTSQSKIAWFDFETIAENNQESAKGYFLKLLPEDKS